MRKYRFRKKYESRKFCSFDDCQVIVSQGVNSDARLDAIATLAALPKRLLRIGKDRLNGRKLSEKDYAYWRRHKAKLECRRNSKEIWTGRKGKYYGSMTRVIRSTRSARRPEDVMKPSNGLSITGINLVQALTSCSDRQTVKIPKY